MSNIMSALKNEIVRLARKEAKAATDPIRKPLIAARKSIADLKRRVADLEKKVKGMDAALVKLPQPEAEPAQVTSRNWISGKGVRSLRLKLGLTQNDFAKLVGVTSKGVAKWESNPGMLRMRNATKAAVMAARPLTVRTARERLAALQPAKKPAKRRK